MSSPEPAEAVRLYHLAREWDMSPTVLVRLLRSGGLEVDSHFTQVPRDSIPELEVTLARGRKAKAAAEESAKAAAEESAKAAEESAKAAAEESAKAAEESAKAAAEESAKAAEAKALDAGSATEDAQVALPSIGRQATADDAPKTKKRRRRRRGKKSKTGTTERPTRSLYGSGRLTPTEPAPAPAKPRTNNDGVAPAVPSFGQRAAGSPAPVAPSAVTPTSKNGAQPVASAPAARSSAPASLAPSQVRRVRPQPPAIPEPTFGGAPSTGGLVLIVLSLVAVVFTAVFALIKG